MDAALRRSDLDARSPTPNPQDRGGEQAALIAPAADAGTSAGYTERLVPAAEQVRRFVARRVSNRADAEDIAQQTLLVALAKRGEFRGGSFSSWLFTIARHLIVDHYRDQRRHEFVQLETPSSKRAELALQTAPDGFASACDSRNRLRCWMTCVTHHLPVKEQVAILLADVYGHRDKDSAALLDMSLPSFKLLLHGARVRLRRHGKPCSLANAGLLGGPDRFDVAAAGSETATVPDPSPQATRGGRGPTVTRLLALRAQLLEGLSLVVLVLWLVAVIASSRPPQPIVSPGSFVFSEHGPSLA